MPHNETHRVNGCSAAGLSETTAGVSLNEVLMGRQVHVNTEQEGTGAARGEGRAVPPECSKSSYRLIVPGSLILASQT